MIFYLCYIQPTNKLTLSVDEIMIGAPIGNEYGGCLWTASGDMVCSEKSKLNYYRGAGTVKDEKQKSMSKRTGHKGGEKKETFKKHVPDGDESDEEGDDNKEAPMDDDDEA